MKLVQTAIDQKHVDPTVLVLDGTSIAPLGLDKLRTYRPLYTIQAMVAPSSHIIVSYMCQPRVGDNRHVDRFHGRGLRRTTSKTGLMILAQNLFRFDRLQQNIIKSIKTTS